jgi:heme exporter protein C
MDVSAYKGVHLIGLIGIAMMIGLPRSKAPFAWEHPVGAWGLLWLGVGCSLGLFWAPKELMMGDVGRILYVHVPAAWISLVVFTVGFVCAIGYLMTSKPGWDWAVEAACEVGVLLNALLLVLGSIFGKPTWGVWWTWDPRLTASLVMMLTFIGVILLRGAVRDADRRATWSSVATIVAYLNIPITYMSVRWWATIHQAQSTPDTVDPRMTLVLRMCAWAFLMVAVWFMARRWRIAQAHAIADMPEPLLPHADTPGHPVTAPPPGLV